MNDITDSGGDMSVDEANEITDRIRGHIDERLTGQPGTGNPRWVAHAGSIVSAQVISHERVMAALAAINRQIEQRQRPAAQR